MTAEQFEQWLSAMKAAKLATTGAAAARLLDVHENTMTKMRRHGCDRRTALACTALFHRMEAWGHDAART